MNTLESALHVAKCLEDAENRVSELTDAFARESNAVTKQTRLELWHGDNGKIDVYYWKSADLPSTDRNKSVDYFSRVEAITALINNNVKWTRE